MTRKTAMLISLIVAIISVVGMFTVVERQKKKIDFVYVYITAQQVRAGDLVNNAIKKIRVSSFDAPRILLKEGDFKKPVYAKQNIPENTILSPSMLTANPNTRNVEKGYTTVLVPVDQIGWNLVRPNDYVAVFAIAKFKDESQVSDTPSVITIIDKARVINVLGNDAKPTFEIAQNGKINEKPPNFVELEVTMEDASRIEWYIEVAKIVLVKIPD